MKWKGKRADLLRHPHYIWDQLADDRLWATFIPDGHHLTSNVLKVMIRAKRDMAIWVSDCVKFGGMPTGRYTSLIGAEVELHANGRLNTAANPAILAGSAQSLDQGIATAVRLAGIGLGEAIEAASLRPAKAMGLQSLGTLQIGAVANLTLFHYPDSEGNLHIKETVFYGKRVYKGAKVGKSKYVRTPNIRS